LNAAARLQQFVLKTFGPSLMIRCARIKAA